MYHSKNNGLVLVDPPSETLSAYNLLKIKVFEVLPTLVSEWTDAYNLAPLDDGCCRSKHKGTRW